MANTLFNKIRNTINNLFKKKEQVKPLTVNKQSAETVPNYYSLPEGLTVGYGRVGGHKRRSTGSSGVDRSYQMGDDYHHRSSYYSSNSYYDSSSRSDSSSSCSDSSSRSDSSSSCSDSSSSSSDW